MFTLWKKSRKWLSFQGEASFRLSMLRGIFPQKYKEVFGRFYISGRVKTLPVVMRDQGREGSFRGQGEPVQPPVIWGFLDHSLPSAGNVPREGRRAQSKRSGPAPAPLPGPCYLAPGASTGGFLGLSVRLSSVQFSSVVSDSLWPHESHHTRPPCPSPTPRVYSDSCPSSRWCHSAISSSVVPFSSCPQSLPASGSFPTSQLSAWVL